MYILNFSFLAQFGEQLCVKQTPKKRKNDEKATLLGLLRDEMGLKTSKRYINDLYLMCIPNFTFLAQFGGSYARNELGKIKKTT